MTFSQYADYLMVEYDQDIDHHDGAWCSCPDGRFSRLQVKSTVGWVASGGSSRITNCVVASCVVSVLMST